MRIYQNTLMHISIKTKPLKTWHDVLNVYIFIIYLIKFQLTFIYPISMHYTL